MYIRGGVGSRFKFGGGGHELSGALLDTERAPSNIIWTLFEYILYILLNKNGTFHHF